jgi:hypothetical protein
MLYDQSTTTTHRYARAGRGLETLTGVLSYVHVRDLDLILIFELTCESISIPPQNTYALIHKDSQISECEWKILE